MSGYLSWMALMATHKTRSPPPPALQYGWKKATVRGEELEEELEDASAPVEDVCRRWKRLNHHRNKFRNPGRREKMSSKVEVKTTLAKFQRVTGRVSDIVF